METNTTKNIHTLGQRTLEEADPLCSRPEDRLGGRFEPDFSSGSAVAEADGSFYEGPSDTSSETGER